MDVRNSASQVRSLLITSILMSLLLVANSSSANSFAAIQSEISSQTLNLENLENQLGRYHLQLLEPLQQLAFLQVQANRFSDAEASLDRAVQIARLGNGLFTNTQYRLLQLSIEINIQRKDWEQAEEQLEHFTWLIQEKFDGAYREELKQMQWLSDTHLQAALQGDSTRRAKHLIAATSLNELAVQRAQITHQADNQLYAELLYSLAQNYFIEMRGILGGGSTSYKLRQKAPDFEVIESRATAIYRRYWVGLEKLIMLRDLTAESDAFDQEAVALAELYIADWKLIFDETANISEEYSIALQALSEAGVAATELNRFFAQPVSLPRPELHLTFSEAFGAIKEVQRPGNLIASGEANQGMATPTQYRLSLIEPSSQVMGYVQDSANSDLAASDIDEWRSISVSMMIDPNSRISVRHGAYFTKSAATPSELEIHNSPNLAEKLLQGAISRIKTLSFRPALINGHATPKAISLDFVFRKEERSSSLRLLGLK
jgi:hypothetical protein